MSSNDSTRPEDEGRTVATDAARAGQSPPAADAERSSAASDPAASTANGTASGSGETDQAGSPSTDAAGRPSPVPRTADHGTAADAGGQSAAGTAAAGTQTAASARPSPTAATGADNAPTAGGAGGTGTAPTSAAGGTGAAPAPTASGATGTAPASTTGGAAGAAAGAAATTAGAANSAGGAGADSAAAGAARADGGAAQSGAATNGVAADPAGEPPAGGDAAAGGSGAAEGPPPWRRVPGEHPSPAPEPDERPSVADSLLSEAPTAFLASPRPSGPESGAAAEEPVAAAGTATAVEEPTDLNGRAGDVGVRSPSRNRPPRQAMLQLKRLDPWSVLKMALALAVVLFLVWMVAAGVLYGVLGGMGVWDRLNGTYADLVTGQVEQSASLISAGRVFLLAAVVGAINSLLFAVAMTLGAFVYNVAADLVGGIEVTLSERD